MTFNIKALRDYTAIVIGSFLLASGISIFFVEAKVIPGGATALHGRGLYSNQEREILYTVITRKEISLLTEIVEKIDPHAFIIINNVHEVLGQGFRPRI